MIFHFKTPKGYACVVADHISAALGYLPEGGDLLSVKLPAHGVAWRSDEFGEYTKDGARVGGDPLYYYDGVLCRYRHIQVGPNGATGIDDRGFRVDLPGRSSDYFADPAEAFRCYE